MDISPFSLVLLIIVLLFAGVILGVGQGLVSNMELILIVIFIFLLLYCIAIWIMLIRESGGVIISTICSVIHLYGTYLLYHDRAAVLLRNAANQAFFSTTLETFIAIGVWMFLEWIFLSLASMKKGYPERGLSAFGMISGAASYILIIKLILHL